MLHRIYTERVNVAGIVARVTSVFDGFTLIETRGYWKGDGEDSLIIEVVTGDRAKVLELARGICEMNEQEAVLLLSGDTGVLVDKNGILTEVE